ncbi:MAG: radical SAM protein, partial [Afipia sp.]|nr:radical SAM protein [Afipia sp.]
NKYDLNHICTTHARMSPEEWNRAYKMAWDRYYTREHIETILRRAAAMRANVSNALFLITWFTGSILIEKIHPLESGLLRRRFRRARRPGFPIESALSFYPRYYFETVMKMYRWSALYLGLRGKYLEIKRNPKRFEYTDLALTPVTDEEEDREMFQSGAAKAYLDQQHRLEKARHAAE